ncbi:1-phosphatidylinositol 4,5-bisphosphate phosphodiesterase beta-2 [Erpetoichthys calabaricus]|uniref:1-phosphatidylinositol 4,5-bisphosphate phosphodiesterase beta-2 n=1 Tax=Erpetoichthys calabaricus TaxID=27687 RepID=UPI00223455FB|nr:1-phosphatidylinositol 4,5-bisphosphate phosphodiesterase beta-2 [Erpetoichthys calabaricus]
MEKAAPILKAPEVKEYLIKGARFTKWDDDTGVTSPVMMKMDPKGYYVYWTHQNKEMEFLDITCIRDTRVGKYAKIPKTPKVRNVFNLDFPENNYLAKTLTIVSGPDVVNLSYSNFFAYKENIAKDWADDILSIAYNPLTNNACRQVFLEKIYVRITLQTNKDGKIPVKNIYQMFPSDRKKVEAALTSCHLPKGKNDSMKPEEFSESVYKSFLMHLCPRPEIYEIFTSYNTKAKPYMTKENFCKFINEKQRDSRLNEILFPRLKPEQVKALIERYEPSQANVQRGQISPEGLLFYLLGPENSVVDPEKLLIYQNMAQPLPHYYIKSSHNTYLTAGQFSGVSSPEMYRQCLLTGCRCVELDCWNGKPPDEEPIITHGFTMTTEILFKDVIEAIAESAFKTSQYPVILSFENHVDSVKQQKKMADYCKNIFGEALLIDPLEKYPLKPGQQIPSPSEMLGKILIKNKKNQSRNESAQGPAKKNVSGDASGPEQDSSQMPTTQESEPTEEAEDREEVDEAVEEDEEQMKNSDEGTAGQEVTAFEEMSALVNYIQPNKFVSFEHAKKKNRSYVVSSFVETKAIELVTKFPVEFVDYNKRQMSRIYPKGTRMDSSNYNPQIFWNAGCQMVALNYQTMDFPMQLNMAMFEFNSRTGYLLKHDFMRRTEKRFDPYAMDRIDVIVSNTLSIKIYSGQFLSDKNVKTAVEVEVIGLPGDPKRKYRTKWTSTPNSINPVWKEEPFVFDKILMPEMASLRIAVYEEGGKLIGHRIIPVHVLRSGFHHVCLRSESNMPLTLPSLFVYIEVKDYIPESFAELSDVLSNPLKFSGSEEKSSVKKKAEEPLIQKTSVQQESTGACVSEITTSTITLVSGGPSSAIDSSVSCLSSQPAALENTSKPVTDAKTASIEEVQQSKVFGKFLKKQEKEIKEVDKKFQKKEEELTQKYTSLFSEMHSQLKKKKPGSLKNQKKKSDSIDLSEPAVLPDSSSSPRVTELKEKLRAELTRLHEEQHELVKKKREQHVSEQTAKLLEVAKEQHASEQKSLKDSLDSDMKEVKKKLEVKRNEKMINLAKSGSDKVTMERKKKELNNTFIQDVVQMMQRFAETTTVQQEKLEKKQTATVDEIQEKADKLLQEVTKELERKAQGISKEVQEILNGCISPYFPEEVETLKDTKVLENGTNNDQLWEDVYMG